MTGAVHTAGPWAYRPYEHDDWGVVRAPADANSPGGVICQAQNPAISWDDYAAYRQRGDDPYEANARLIAAAPCLLEALRAALASARDYDPWIEQALEVIAKIEGAA